MMTFKLRSKEDAPEYRYMPDPNLPPLILTEVGGRVLLIRPLRYQANVFAWGLQKDIDRVRRSMPELPQETAARLERSYGLVSRDIQVLMSVGSGTNVGYDGEIGPGNAVQYFEVVAKGRDPKIVVNWCVKRPKALWTDADDGAAL